MWNFLTTQCSVNFSTLDVFKRSIVAVDFSSFIQISSYSHVSMAALSDIIVLAVLLVLFRCTCYSLTFEQINWLIDWLIASNSSVSSAGSSHQPSTLCCSALCRHFWVLKYIHCRPSMMTLDLPQIAEKIAKSRVYLTSLTPSYRRVSHPARWFRSSPKWWS